MEPLTKEELRRISAGGYGGSSWGWGYSPPPYYPPPPPPPPPGYVSEVVVTAPPPPPPPPPPAPPAPPPPYVPPPPPPPPPQPPPPPGVYGGGGGVVDVSLHSHTTPSGTKYTYQGYLSSSQLTIIDQIVDAGKRGGYSDEGIKIAVDRAFQESSLGVFNSNGIPGNTASGLYQYTDGTWAQYHSDMTKSSTADQIDAFYSDLSTFAQSYSNDIASGAITSSMSLEDYVNVKFNFGMSANPNNYSTQNSNYEANVGQLGFSVLPGGNGTQT
jgi:hypothetical protein